MKKLFIISLGGSLIVPDDVDTKFLSDFKKLINNQVKSGNKFIIITGGGKTCRKYQAALKQIGNTHNSDLDWMGIYTTTTNAQLVRLMFGRLAHPHISETVYYKKINFKEKILVTGGFKPGRSSDGAMVQIAKTYAADTVVNLSNIDYVYDKDPRKFNDAKKIKNIAWKNFFKIIGTKWNPGANVPFDPTAARLAQKNNIKVIIANGKNLKNLQNILNGKPFQGTTIS